jgi:sugar/nucleoside kinase (ribokinase family)
LDKEFDILCIGLINVNLLVRPIDKSVFDIDVTLVDNIDLLPGGDALNEAVVLAKLGNSVGLIGKVGTDVFGDAILKTLEDNHVNTKNISVDSNVKTSACVVLIDETGNRNFATFRGANSVLSIKDIDLSVIKKTKIVNIGSLFALKLLDRDGIEEIFKEAKLNNVVTAADTKQDTYNLGFDGIKGILKYTDFFLPSYDEAAFLTKEKDPVKMAEIFLSAGVKTVVIKLGSKGCYIKSASESHMIGPYEDTEVVDTTGAGDNFVAGFLTGVIKGWDFKKCGIFGNATGSVSVQKVGAISGVSSLEQVVDFMNKNKICNIID